MKIIFWVAVILVLLKSGQTRSEFVKISRYDINLTKVDSFLYILEELGISNSEIVLAQAILETGNFKSQVCRENFNHFGMKFNKRGYAKGTRNGHAWYKNSLDSYLDYKEWQDNAKKVWGQNLTDEQYLHLLDSPYKDKRRYAEDKHYTEKLKLIIKKIRLARSVVGKSPLSLG